MSSETMALLAEEYQTGILVVSAVVWALYITMLVLSIVIRYKRVGKVSLVGVIPVIHIALLFMDSRKSQKKKELKKKKDEEKDVFEDVF